MNRSTEITKIAPALVKFRSLVEPVKKDSVNPYFKSKYAGLTVTIESVKAPLKECGLTFVQMPTGANSLSTMILHESGEFLEDTYEICVVGMKPQEIGSAITYARRYALGAALGIATEEDDDGNAASQPTKEISSNKTVKVAAKGSAGFDALMKLVPKAKTTELVELRDKMLKSDKYTDTQKDVFNNAVEERLMGEEIKS